MPIPCSTSTVESFQILDPTPVVPPGGTIGQYQESGSLQLQIGVAVYNVTFATAKISALYIFDSAVIVNTTDDPCPEFDFTISGQTTTGFQITVNPNPLTVNSFFSWSVRILT